MSSDRMCAITFDFYLLDPRVRRLAEAAVDAGYAVDVICLRQPHEKCYEIHNNVHVYRIPMKRGFGRTLPFTVIDWCLFLLLAAVTVTYLHLKRAYKIIQVHNMPDFLIFAALLPKLLGAKIILDIQDASPELMAVKAKGWVRKVVVALAIVQEQCSIGLADHIVTIGWTLECVLYKRGVPLTKMISVVNSADPKCFSSSKRGPTETENFSEEHPCVLLYHGTLAERQGLDIAIRALALACTTAPHMRLEMKGRGEHLPALKALAEELGVSDRVHFSDSCPYEEVADFILGGHIGIIPYRRDGYMEFVLPTKAFEFAWMQRPIIAADMPGIRSLFRAGSVAFCEPANPESFAAAIIDLYHDMEKRARMVTDALEDYTFYHWEIMAARYQRLLKMLS